MCAFLPIFLCKVMHESCLSTMRDPGTGRGPRNFFLFFFFTQISLLELQEIG